MPHLVDDVVLDILDMAYRPALHLPDYHMLSCFSLVSKFWAGEAQKRLFGEGMLQLAGWRVDILVPFREIDCLLRPRTVWLPTTQRITQFLGVVRNGSERGKQLGSLVRKLRVGFGTSGVFLAYFSKLYASLPELDALELFLDSWTRFSNPTLDQLKTSLQPFPQLLTFSVISNCDHNILALLPLLGSHLEFLSIPRSKYSPYTVSMTHRYGPPSSPPQFSLYELRWSGPTIWLKWILSNSTDSLTILELHGTLKDEDFEAVLKTHGGKLLSLRLPDQVLSDSAAKALTHCTRLREFKYNHFPTSGITRHLPTTIEHLEIVDSLVIGTRNRSQVTPPIAADEDGEEFFKWIERSMLVVLTWGKAGGKEMKKLCENLAIEYRFLASPIGSYPGERSVHITPSGEVLMIIRSREELFYADDFPRSCYLSPGRNPPAGMVTEGADERPARIIKRGVHNTNLNVADSPGEGSETSCSRTERVVGD